MRCFRDSKHPVAVFMVKLSFTLDHQMVGTREGRFGFTCTGARLGDVVCVFNNSVSPFVIRKVDEMDDRTRWRFVGDAYVDGLMYGEADALAVEEENVLLM
jgi:hypothetical protein